MSRYQSDPEDLGYTEQSACGKCLHYTWKTITCLFSHITLVSMVVSYCVLGAVTFESLEVEHEKDVKRNISKLRKNVTEHLWKLTQDSPLLKVDNFTFDATKYLKEFENALLKAMTIDGWDGEEDENKVQWTSTGALFYSIIVITTIGYGHIAPKTTWGKVVTIFYAILGIPLMLLCLSNIGDIMATSFRFLYWRVCCYVCTKKPKKNRARTKSFRATERPSRSRNASFRRSVRTSTKSADSGYEFSSRSESDLRYIDERGPHRRGQSLPRMKYSRSSQNSEQNHKKSNDLNKNIPPYNQKGASLDRRKFQKRNDLEMDYLMLARTPVLCNKYVCGKNDLLSNNITGITPREIEVQQGKSFAQRRARSMPRPQRNFLDIPDRYPSPPSSDKEDDDDISTKSNKSDRPKKSGRSRSKSPMPYNSSPKMMTPLGYGHRNVYLDESSGDEYYVPGSKSRTKPVPIWLCLCLVISYIIAGAFLFDYWENWGFLNSAYFCFITLTTIGFGDLVPAKGVSQEGTYATVSIALCSLYLLFGISLLAMSFNLVQEEVISNVKSVAKTLGIIKNDSDESDDEM